MVFTIFAVERVYTSTTTFGRKLEKRVRFRVTWGEKGAENDLKWILFDFDGTLVDSAAAFVHAWNEASPKYGFKPLRLEDVPSLLKYTIKERAAMYDFPMYKLPIILPGIYKTYRQNMHLITLKPNAKETIERLLQKGYRLAVLSSNDRQNITTFLEQHELEGFEEILTSSKIFGKDAVMKKFLKSQALRCEDVLYVGDELRDIVACEKVGLPIAAVSWGFDARTLLQSGNPPYIVDDFYALHDTIEQHFASVNVK